MRSWWKCIEDILIYNHNNLPLLNFLLFADLFTRISNIMQSSFFYHFCQKYFAEAVTFWLVLKRYYACTLCAGHDYGETNIETPTQYHVNLILFTCLFLHSFRLHIRIAFAFYNFSFFFKLQAQGVFVCKLNFFLH